jgi:hypothetical protein
MSRCRASRTPQQPWYTRLSNCVSHLTRHNDAPSLSLLSSGQSFSSASDVSILTYTLRQGWIPISPSSHRHTLSSSVSFRSEKHMALPVSCLLEMCFWFMTNRLDNAKRRSPLILGWSNESISPHNNAKGLYVWLACMYLLVPKFSPRFPFPFPFLSLCQWLSDDCDLLDPRSCWPELLWRDLVYSRIIMRVAELITLDHTRVERNQRRSKSDVTEIAVLRNHGLARVFMQCVRWNNVD